MEPIETSFWCRTCPILALSTLQITKHKEIPQHLSEVLTTDTIKLRIQPPSPTAGQNNTRLLAKTGSKLKYGRLYLSSKWPF